jgi:hypothetical protein
MRHAITPLHAKPVPRQTVVLARLTLVMVVVLCVVLALAVFQITHLDWSSFTFRPPGIGGTSLPGDD